MFQPALLVVEKPAHSKTQDVRIILGAYSRSFMHQGTTAERANPPELIEFHDSRTGNGTIRSGKSSMVIPP